MEILIIKTGALGDVVRSSFVAQALKDKYQKNRPKITWVTSSSAKSILINNPFIDTLLVEDQKYSLKSKKFDLVVNLEEDEENAKFVSQLNPKNIQGFYWKDEKIVPSPSAKYWFDMSMLGKKPQNDILKKQNKLTHREILCDIVEVKNKNHYHPYLQLTNKQKLFSEKFAQKNKISKADIIIGLNTGSADRWPKHLSIEKTLKLISLLNKKHPRAKLILFGGPNEKQRNQEIINKSSVKLIDAGCENSLEEFTALISLCSLFVTTDTLGLHLSLATKRKTICLLGPTSNSEIHLYGLGEKVIAKSDCLCCYKKDCKSMEKIDLAEVIKKSEKLLEEKIAVVITAYKEPNTIGKAIRSALKQTTKKPYYIVVSAPDKETLEIAKKYSNKNVKVIQDPGKGKSFALNFLFEKINADIIILSDGDVHINPEAVEKILEHFEDSEVGCVTGRPVPLEGRNTKWGYWANFLFDSAHKLRKKYHEKDSFLECSGYLFAFRKNQIKQIPLDVAEDTIIPYIFWERGFKIKYSEESKVYVKNVNNYPDWINQKVRCAKAHETLPKYVNTQKTKRVKSFSTEAKGIIHALAYPKNTKEIFWTLELILLRLQMWVKVFKETKFQKKSYTDNWKRVESTK